MTINVSNCAEWKTGVGDVWGLTCIGQELFCRVVSSPSVNVYNTETGELTRTISLACSEDWGSLGTDGTDLYVVSAYKLYKVSKEDGSIVSPLCSLPGEVHYTQTFAIKNGKVFTGSYSQGFWIIDIVTGAILQHTDKYYNVAFCYLDDANWIYLTTRYGDAKFCVGTSDRPIIEEGAGTIVGSASNIENAGIGIDVKNKKLFTASYTAGKLHIYDISGLSNTTPTDTPSTTGNGLLQITMSDSSEREYKLSNADIDKFIQWINSIGRTGDNSYKFNVTIDGSKEYLVFDKIISFKVIPLAQ